MAGPIAGSILSYYLASPANVAATATVSTFGARGPASGTPAVFEYGSTATLTKEQFALRELRSYNAELAHLLKNASELDGRRLWPEEQLADEIASVLAKMGYHNELLARFEAEKSAKGQP